MSSRTASSVSWYSPVHLETSSLIRVRLRLMNSEAAGERRCRGSAENNREQIAIVCLRRVERVERLFLAVVLGRASG